MQGGSRRITIWLGILVLLIGGAGYAWTFTPSYSLYHIRQALLAHDYATFSYYVDVDSVLDHALDEFSRRKQPEDETKKPRGPLAKLFKKGILKDFVQDAREVVKAGLEIALEQAIRDQERPLPEIPSLAVVAALWHGQTEEDVVSFPIKMKKKEMIGVKAKKNEAGIWRVIEITNLTALLPALRRHQERQQSQAES
jgi:hypothetical protein